MKTHAEQLTAIFREIGIPIINDKFRAYLIEVVQLAAEAFDDDGSMRMGDLSAVKNIPATYWGSIKGELQTGLGTRSITAAERKAWSQAFEAIYRMMGVEDVQPCDAF